jgi:hypothetical protein
MRKKQLIKPQGTMRNARQVWLDYACGLDSQLYNHCFQPIAAMCTRTKYNYLIFAAQE